MAAEQAAWAAVVLAVSERMETAAERAEWAAELQAEAVAFERAEWELAREAEWEAESAATLTLFTFTGEQVLVTPDVRVARRQAKRNWPPALPLKV